jgi:2-hydroxychromene-2-carboxylate isomerase
LWARHAGAQPTQTYVQRVFERFWREELDLEDPLALGALLTEVGAPGFGAFARGEGRAELDRMQAESIQAGIVEVPTFMLDGDTYVGRQHLPLIRALLSGKK